MEINDLMPKPRTTPIAIPPQRVPKEVEEGEGGEGEEREEVEEEEEEEEEEGGEKKRVQKKRDSLHLERNGEDLEDHPLKLDCDLIA